MAKKDRRGFLGRLTKQVTSVEGSRFFHGIKAFQGRLRTGVVRFVPARLLWLVPFLQEELDLRPPSVEQLKERVFSPPSKPALQDLAEVEGGVAAGIALPQRVKSLYPEYRCVQDNPFACEWTQQTLLEEPTAKYCIKCGFPALLPPAAKIRGNRGTYQVEAFLKHRGRGRLYQGIRLPDRQPVFIKEYLLPERIFNLQEARQRKEAFLNLAGVTLADGRVQDVRLIPVWDAIADARQERCYLVTKGNIDAYPTLASYIAETGAMTSAQVRTVLNQVLQSLEFLHDQKYRLRSGLVQEGLTDGNLSLDSLLLVPSFQGFFIYLCDLILWEGRFDPPLVQRPLSSPAKDLQDLGYTAFYLLAGGTYNSTNGQWFNPRVKEHWTPIHPAFKDYILSLMGLGMTSFESAEIARRALLKLPPEPEIQWLPLEGVPEEDETKKRRFQFPWWLLGVLGLVLLGILLWWLFARNEPRGAVVADSLPCCIEQVSGIPPGNFTYTAERYGPWDYVLQRENLIAKGTTLEAEILERQPKLELIYKPQPSWTEAIADIRSEEAEFAIASLTERLSFNLAHENFAHDGLVVFVPFSYARRENSLPQALKGKITFEALRQLYSDRISNWQELGGPNLPIKLYIPPSQEAIEIFEQRVLKDTASIETFRDLIKQSNRPSNRVFTSRPTITRLQTFDTLREVIRDFEDRDIGAIGFDSLSKILGQCSVYPLALVEGDKPPITPLILNNNLPVTPSTDLCNAKGSYGPNVKAFVTQTYPLAYPLAVIYPRDNSRPIIGEKFAEILKTLEAQRLLYKSGLVPLQPLP
ncbi:MULTISPECIES: substrate-binding domain-containing protein [unclassified Coleofasciculus]|uniref:substrate-binding domain-containing protein n=1 Tax=unclassified Coleofasciculus TaxID=2692782 RepID=UPI0018816166|nr:MULTISPECIES: substrate-binding domain-containing protein [unclassified Coleofasciculus]MBE9126990.1 substrate-binding domain-containing protein [Coleofasciculus sp. LEGE 07081]MBE9150327.1 substrate-binding domain-containing protein [Coleofasciculus sp. LEGE 07092]